MFDDWRLTLWGSSIDAASQQLHPLPDEHDDDHNIEDAPYATVSIKPHTKTTPPTSATDHADRPINEKPSEKPSEAAAQPTASVVPPTPIEEEEKPASTVSTVPTPVASHGFLPSFLPTFGTKPHTQIWIYASVSLILVFCIGLGVYFQVQRRKRLRNNPHDDYEFEIIDEDDDDAEAPLAGRSGRRRRGGELYNAFAEESDEELLSEDEEGLYKDHPGAINEKQKSETES